MRDYGVWININGRSRFIEFGILSIVKLLNSKNIATIGSCEGHGEMAWVQVENIKDYFDAQETLREYNIRYVKILDPSYNGKCSKTGIYWDGKNFIEG